MSELAKLVIKRFPENRNMQMVCLRTSARFNCSRCKKPRHNKLLAVVSEDWRRLLCVACYEKTLAEPLAEPLEKAVSTQWLGNAVLVRHAEEDNMVNDVPFGEQAAEWEELKAAMIDGDELREFTSPTDAPEHLADKTGYALVRQEKIIKCIVLAFGNP